MPFPIDLKYIEQAEQELGVTLPEIFKAKMMKENGGEVGTDKEGWTLFPFLDKSDNKRISRTNNDIVLETRNARQWNKFPKDAVAIGENGSGDYLLLQPIDKSKNQISEIPYSWWHETGEIHKVGESITDLLAPDNM